MLNAGLAVRSRPSAHGNELGPLFRLSAAVAYGLFRDQRGGDFGRIADFGDDDDFETIDIGALELAFDEEYS